MVNDPLKFQHREHFRPLQRHLTDLSHISVITLANSFDTVFYTPFETANPLYLTVSLCHIL